MPTLLEEQETSFTQQITTSSRDPYQEQVIGDLFGKLKIEGGSAFLSFNGGAKIETIFIMGKLATKTSYSVKKQEDGFFIHPL